MQCLQCCAAQTVQLAVFCLGVITPICTQIELICRCYVCASRGQYHTHMSTYLENYVDSLKGLPNDLTRGFLLMRQLDKKANEQHAELERASDAAFKKISNMDKKSDNPSATSEDNCANALRDVRNRQRDVLGLQSEKVALVVQAQAIVCIRFTPPSFR